MTPDKLIVIMKRQNLSVMDLATIVAGSKRQVIAWRMGTSPVPQILSILLLALEDGLITQDWLVESLQNELRDRAA
jgi:hypothetical protein